MNIFLVFATLHEHIFINMFSTYIKVSSTMLIHVGFQYLHLTRTLNAVHGCCILQNIFGFGEQLFTKKDLSNLLIILPS